jgi:hypothetical protein
MTCRHGFVRLKSRARRQAQRKTRNSDERPEDGLMTAFLEFANLADIVLARDSAAVLALARLGGSPDSFAPIFSSQGPAL